MKSLKAQCEVLLRSPETVTPMAAQDMCEHIIEMEAEVKRLSQFDEANKEWFDKTDWVRTDKRFDPVRPLGKHRADVLREYIEHLEAQLNATPFMYGIAEPEGSPYMAEFCVSSDPAALADEISDMNADIPDGEPRYTVVKLANVGEVKP